MGQDEGTRASRSSFSSSSAGVGPDDEDEDEDEDATKTGMASVTPMRMSCRKVLYFETMVGWTSAEGSEKSQYRAKVLGAGSEA